MVKRDKFGKLHCDCGALLTIIKSDYPDGEGERLGYLCMNCLMSKDREFNEESFIPVTWAEKLYPREPIVCPFKDNATLHCKWVGTTPLDHLREYHHVSNEFELILGKAFV